MKIDSFLSMAVKKKASDIHLIAGVSPVIRVNTELIWLDMPPLRNEDTLNLAGQILSKERQEIFTKMGEVDASYGNRELGLFRINVYRQRGTVGIAVRVINSKAPTIDELNLPEIVRNFSRLNKGLILVTGPTGSGKSTTLAAMTEQINMERACHVVTLEDPIEYVHNNRKSIITQREIGRDSESFPNGLRSALRQDPDVILVGEMRDLDTISIAVTAAETGHLVLATLHTINAAQTIERIIDAFQHTHQQQIRIQLANTLAGVVSQRLIRRKDGSGMVAAMECMVTTPAVRTLIREGKAYQINSFIETGTRLGMQTMDKHLKLLFDQKIISGDEAVENAGDPEQVKEYIKSRGGGAGLDLTGSSFSNQ